MAAVASDYLWILVVGSIFMAIMAFLIGANDVANTFGTSVGSKAVTVPTAAMLGGVFEIVGAVALGGTVSDAIRSKTLDFDAFADDAELLMFGMLCALVGAVTWLTIATSQGWPVSTTHSIVGAILGFGLATGRADAVDWEGIGLIVVSWIASPVLSGLLAALFFFCVRYGILRAQDPVKVGFRYLWLLIFIVCETFTLMIMIKNSWRISGVECEAGLDDNGVMQMEACTLEKWVTENIGVAIGISIGIAAGLTAIFSTIFYWYATQQLKKYDMSKADAESLGVQDSTDESVHEEHIPENGFMKVLHKLGFRKTINSEALSESKKAREIHASAEVFNDRTEKYFSTVQVLSACFDSLAHGSNDVANAVGPFATILEIYRTGAASSRVSIASWVLAIGGIGIALGLCIFGTKVMKTIGVKLAKVTPSRGTTIELGASWVTIFFTNLGVPLSTTHCQVGAIVGVGLLESWGGEKGGMKKPAGIDLILLAKIFAGWVATLVAAACTTALVFSFAAYAPTMLEPISVAVA